jgi:hypothetical protein
VQVVVGVRVDADGFFVFAVVMSDAAAYELHGIKAPFFRAVSFQV